MAHPHVPAWVEVLTRSVAQPQPPVQILRTTAEISADQGGWYPRDPDIRSQPPGFVASFGSISSKFGVLMGTVKSTSL